MSTVGLRSGTPICISVSPPLSCGMLVSLAGLCFSDPLDVDDMVAPREIEMSHLFSMYYVQTGMYYTDTSKPEILNGGA